MWLEVGITINATVPKLPPVKKHCFTGGRTSEMRDYQAIGEACEELRIALHKTHGVTVSKSTLYNAARAARVLTPAQQAVCIKRGLPMREVSFLCAAKMDKKRADTIAEIAKNGRVVNMAKMHYAARKGPVAELPTANQGASGLCNITLYGHEGDEHCQNAMDSFVAALWQMRRDPEAKFKSALARAQRAAIGGGN